ncbi:MAG TPA: T9SS type A sorting domain-containing protein [Candidatus Kapabacteria bacterium]|nr:T9SS type A sorting domain-containing protein [Candidatus Kapabacteria bacterium]
MTTRNLHTRFSALAALLVLTAAPLCAQVSSDIPLTVSDHGDGTVPGGDTLYFGFHPSATNGRDAALGEEEQPPAPPEGVFDVRWVNVGSSKDFGQGVKRNYHAYTSSTQSDTFRLRVQPGFKPGSNGYPVTLTWPSLSKYFTGAALRFVDGDGNPTAQDMMSTTSFSFTNPSSVSSTVTIVTTGPISSADVSEADAVLNFGLVSSPNPVKRNEGATIGYVLPYPAHVTVTLYNALGQAVMEVVNEDQTPARHTNHLDTRNLPAGSYYCRINAGRFSSVRTIILAD